MKLKRALYLGYYLTQLDMSKFIMFLNYAKNVTGKSSIKILTDMLLSVFNYNISVLEYFQFHFYMLSEKERGDWAGTGYMYEYQLRMNPKKYRQILEDKTLFYKNYSEFFTHRVASIEDLQSKPALATAILGNPSEKIVLKSANGNCGKEVEIRDGKDFDAKGLINYMNHMKYDLVEEFIMQHSELNRLSPSAVNTVRIFTQLNEKGGVDILGCRLRISVNSPVDNMAAGNLAAPIDISTGQLCGPGVYSDVTKAEEEYHPVTLVKIEGFKVPYWKETLQMIEKAALLHPQNRSIGWDVVITGKGPGLIEANHDWCKLLWQLPVKQGLKSSLQYN